MFDGEARSRREFLKAAVAAGGASALAACMERSDEPVPTGVEDPSTLPDRQHAWNEFLPRDDAGNVQIPRHHVFLYLTLDRDGPPTQADRETVDAALGTLDRAYEWSHEGLLHSVAYSPRYFERFDATLPASVDLPPPEPLSPLETPALDTQDALVQLASDRADVVLEAEQALLGERETANGVTMEQSVASVASVASRRTGFMGRGMPAERQEVRGIPASKPVPDGASLFMGFLVGFQRNQATEDYVTIDAGPFADGTTKHVVKFRQRLEDWYEEQTFDERVAELFSPEHAERRLVEDVGENLGDDNGVTTEIIENVEAHAREYGRVGHAQKAARGNREADGTVRTLRRHVESTDEDTASLHFPSLQTGISAFEDVQRAMNGTDLTEYPGVRPRVNNGILEYVFVKNRGNFLVPPRRLRALPTPTG